jgi:hypothetical protein
MIDINEICPGFYIGTFENKPEDVLICRVYGKKGFYRTDAWIDSMTSSGVIVSNVDMEKKPIVFLERLNQLNKEK